MRTQSIRVTLSAVLIMGCIELSAGESQKPLMKDFMAINGHTIQFKPELYKQTCLVVRDYHPVEWDLGNDTAFVTTFPAARNRVMWDKVYGSWKKAGYDIDVSLMFETIPHDKWKNIPVDAKAYGLAFAKYFGPSGNNLVTSAEIGNEPGKFDDAKYRSMFENMAKGLREGDPKLKIATCNLVVGKSHDYAKSVNCIEGLNDLYDILNIHTYAELEPWPTFKRTYPEDPNPKVRYLKDIEDLIKWRDEKAAGKPIWITEFGWDASTKPAPKTGDFSKWIGHSEKEQAQWLVRSFFLFAKMPVERAYIYFFNDKDDPHMHGSAGLTRNFQPKPAFHAVAHLLKSLGDYRFSRVIQQKTGEAYVYEFAHGTEAGKRVWAVWSEQMPLAAGDAPKVTVSEKDGSIVVPVDESPTFIWLDGGK
jgi:hypothetical protein